IFEKYKRVVETGERYEDEFAIHENAIKASWLRLQVLKLDDGIAITSSDISARKESELNLAKLAASTASIIASSPTATIVTNLLGTITSVNPAAERMLLYEKEELVERETPLVFLDPRDVLERAVALGEELGVSIEPGMLILTARLERAPADEAEWKFVRRDGSRFDAHVTLSALTTEAGSTVGLVMIVSDVTERKRNEERISHLAYHDALTGLPTRNLFHDRLAVALARARRNDRKVAILMLDLDRFKDVNDRMGHQAGDRLLAHVAACLRRCVRSSDTVARVGGDEFVLVLDDLHGKSEAESVAEKLLRELRAPLEFGARTILPSASVGISLYPDDGDNAEDLLQHADAAMYRAKAGGRNAHRTFDRAMALATGDAHFEICDA
ncbi:MAG: GGDEF domain-containing protein, partial [Candidatus Eremiobacteraeota bacterium]|nr:GGDEF domain-containing protein [Candidatus Eremiobacteraeota bacterium]